jgi:hypothetical protein
MFRRGAREGRLEGMAAAQEGEEGRNRCLERIVID